MLRIYISSSFEDLEPYRKAVAEGLRQLGHLPVGMEDYVAEGSRPLAKCVDDVANSDVYVGVFAHRYGFIPVEAENPKGLSMTELELETARRELGDARCLIFLVDQNMPWPPLQADANSEDKQFGKRIKELKQRLGTDFTVSFFNGVEHLAQLVNTSVSKLPAPAERHVRQINFHCVIGYNEHADSAAVQAIGQGLVKRGLSSQLLPRAVTANTASDFNALERDVVQSHAALIVVTPTLLGIVGALRDKGARALQLMHERTGALILLLQGVSAAELPATWPTANTISAAASVDETCSSIEGAIKSLCVTWDRPTVGLPYIVLGMTSIEAADLFEGRDAGSTEARFQALLPGLKRGGDPVARYGPDRRDWMPFAGQTAEAIAGDIASRMNDAGTNIGHRCVKLQYYALGPWIRNEQPVREIYRALLVSGCVAVVDQVSLFHSAVCDAISAFLGTASKQVAVVAVSPPESLTGEEVRLIERQARDRLAGVFMRFDAELEPTCEFGIGEERRLRRWLNASVPTALNNLADPRPDENRKRQFREVIAPGRARMGAEALLWPDRAR